MAPYFRPIRKSSTLLLFKHCGAFRCSKIRLLVHKSTSSILVVYTIHLCSEIITHLHQVKSYFESENSNSHQISDNVYHCSLHFIHYALNPSLGGRYHFSSREYSFFKAGPFAPSSKGFVFREFSLWEWKFYSCNKSLARFYTPSVGAGDLVFPYFVFIYRIFRPYEAPSQRSYKCKRFEHSCPLKLSRLRLG
jgi:hypothetical protein